MFSATEKLGEIEREIAMRKRVFPREVQSDRMTQEQADRRLSIMEAIAQDYRRPPAVGDLFKEGGQCPPPLSSSRRWPSARARPASHPLCGCIAASTIWRRAAMADDALPDWAEIPATREQAALMLGLGLRTFDDVISRHSDVGAYHGRRRLFYRADIDTLRHRLGVEHAEREAADRRNEANGCTNSNSAAASGTRAAPSKRRSGRRDGRSAFEKALELATKKPHGSQHGG